MLEIKIKMELDLISALLKGKKLTYRNRDEWEITIYPSDHGVFLTMDEYREIRQLACEYPNGRMNGSREIFEKIDERI